MISRCLPSLSNAGGSLRSVFKRISILSSWKLLKNDKRVLKPFCTCPKQINEEIERINWAIIHLPNGKNMSNNKQKSSSHLSLLLKFSFFSLCSQARTRLHTSLFVSWRDQFFFSSCIFNMFFLFLRCAACAFARSFNQPLPIKFTVPIVRICVWHQRDEVTKHWKNRAERRKRR